MWICNECHFELWIPIGAIGASQLGLYDDARFAGRCLLVLEDHFEDFERLSASHASQFVADAQIAAAAIKEVTGCARVNVAILGNAEPHLHWHLIPRYPTLEPEPRKSPWNDPRPQQVLPVARRSSLVAAMKARLGSRTIS